MWTTVEKRTSVAKPNKTAGRDSSTGTAGWEAVFRPPPVRAQAGLMEGCLPSRRLQEERGCFTVEQSKCHKTIPENRPESTQCFEDVNEACYLAERLRCSVGNGGLTRDPARGDCSRI